MPRDMHDTLKFIFVLHPFHGAKKFCGGRIFLDPSSNFDVFQATKVYLFSILKFYCNVPYI